MEKHQNATFGKMLSLHISTCNDVSILKGIYLPWLTGLADDLYSQLEWSCHESARIARLYRAYWLELWYRLQPRRGTLPSSECLQYVQGADHPGPSSTQVGKLELRIVWSKCGVIHSSNGMGLPHPKFVSLELL